MKWLRRMFRGATGNPDPIAFMERLGDWEISDAYRPIDRYRDFRRVFLGSPDGKRVLSQLMKQCHVFAPSFDPDNPNSDLTHVHEGERNIGLFILAVMNAEPDEPE